MLIVIFELLELKFANLFSRNWIMYDEQFIE